MLNEKVFIDLKSNFWCEPQKWQRSYLYMVVLAYPLSVPKSDKTPIVSGPRRNSPEVTCCPHASALVDTCWWNWSSSSSCCVAFLPDEDDFKRVLDVLMPGALLRNKVIGEALRRLPHCSGSIFVISSPITAKSCYYCRTALVYLTILLTMNFDF